MSFPGDSSCQLKNPCSPTYDVQAIIDSQCANDQRKVRYQWKSTEFCDPTGVSLPSDKKISCDICTPGTFINSSKESANRCDPCPFGQFTNASNQNSCQSCPSGYYAMRVRSFGSDITAFPTEGFSTWCEIAVSSNIDYCYFHKGWTIAQGTFTVLPSTPYGAKLILKIKTSITVDTGGALEFKYKLGDSAKERLIMRIKDQEERVLTEATDEETAVSVNLSLGEHDIEFVYTKLRNERITTPAYLSSLKIKGESIGGADSCLKCPQGFYSSSSRDHCEPCPVGTQSEEGGSSCVKCPAGYYRGQGMTKCAQCELHLKPNLEQSE